MEETMNTGVTETTAAQAETKPEGAKDKVEFSPEQQEYLDRVIAREYAKMQKKAEAKIEEFKEAERLKNMSDAERQSAELETARKRIAEFERERLVQQYSVELAEKGLPKELAELIPAQNAESAKKAIDYLANYKAQVEKPLSDRIKELEEEIKNANLRGTPPKAASGTGVVDFNAMSDREYFAYQRAQKKNKN